MASELTVSAALAFKKGGVAPAISKTNITFNVTGTKFVQGIQQIGTSAEALDIGDITTVGWALIENLDSTNFVTVRDGAAGADVVKLKAGEFFVGRLATSTPFLIANTAAVNVQYLVVED